MCQAVLNVMWIVDCVQLVEMVFIYQKILTATKVGNVKDATTSLSSVANVSKVGVGIAWKELQRKIVKIDVHIVRIHGSQ